MALKEKTFTSINEKGNSVEHQQKNNQLQRRLIIFLAEFYDFEAQSKK
jgi:hypothetical protein